MWSFVMITYLKNKTYIQCFFDHFHMALLCYIVLLLCYHDLHTLKKSSSHTVLYLCFIWYVVDLYSSFPVYWPIKMLYNICHIHPFTHTLIHWWQRLPCKVPAAHQEQFWVQYLAQVHFNMQLSSAWGSPSTPWPTAALYKGTRLKKQNSKKPSWGPFLFMSHPWVSMFHFLASAGSKRQFANMNKHEQTWTNSCCYHSQNE